MGEEGRKKILSRQRNDRYDRLVEPQEQTYGYKYFNCIWFFFIKQKIYLENVKKWQKKDENPVTGLKKLKLKKHNVTKANTL